jgi:hypothetical protein
LTIEDSKNSPIQFFAILINFNFVIQFKVHTYRKDIDCVGCADNEMVEIKSINVLNMAEYEIELPVDSYSRVASTFGYDTQTVDLDVIAGTNNQDIHDIQFLIQ